MAISPSDVLNKNKNLKKRVDIDKINLDDVTIDDLKFNGKNYDNYINLMSLLDNVSACQVSDAYNGISRRSGSIQSIKPINNQRVWGSIFTVETDSDDWGTSAMAIDEAAEGDILFFKVSDDDKAIWGELASTCARDNGIKATVIYGSARDLDALLYMDFPVFASNFCPNAGSALGLGTLNEPIVVEDVKINPGDFFIGDESGIVVIPRELFNQTMVATLGVKIKESKIIDDIADGKTLAQITGLK
ncbi:MAG: RraA family protein [Methanobrevibacter sp.]|uniref:RraA family protein n=1 Tax=Methanobrevibacter TaxID=2172 RepID=UPI00257E34BB|nr:RraA family protein [Methanobrevibacter sp.]MBR2666162.1 RraA family protein [Methanobrevibacter sp.]MBR3197433.1 RraA family protein [Methanobrevibacter sp.]MBR7050392.1 RraA family protein [Methanobrevibacter sp.]